MDSLTHLVAGGLTPVVFPRAPKRAAVLWFGILIGELPDIDVFFGNGTPEAFLTLHRGITHALVWQPVLVLIAVLPFYLLLSSRQLALPVPGGSFSAGSGLLSVSGLAPSGGILSAIHARLNSWLHRAKLDTFGLGAMFVAALFAVYTHIYLDCMTTFGTQALLPFSSVRVGFASMFIVDLLLTIPALIILILAWRQPPEWQPCVPCGQRAAFAKPGPFSSGEPLGTAFFSAKAQRLALIGLLWILVYPLFNLGVDTAVTAYLAPRLTQHVAVAEDENAAPRYETKAELTLITEPFSPFVWKAVVDEGDTYRMGTVFLSSLNREPQMTTYAKPEPQLYEDLRKQHPLFVAFDSFCSYMVQKERPASFLTQLDYAEPVTEYSFADLRYIMSPDSPARWFGRTDPNFVLEARVNDRGTLVAYRFLQRGKAADTPWVLLQ